MSRHLPSFLQTGCGVSLFGGFQKPLGPFPGQLALGGPTGHPVGDLEKMTFRDPFPPQPFCDSGIPQNSMKKWANVDSQLMSTFVKIAL